MSFLYFCIYVISDRQYVRFDSLWGLLETNFGIGMSDWRKQF